MDYSTTGPLNHSTSHNSGFTLIELLVVIIIAGAGIGLVAPRFISAYEGIRAAAEEQRLSDIMDAVRMRSFLRQVSYSIEFQGNALNLRNGETRIEFDFLCFAHAIITFNANGFANPGSLRYTLKGEEKVLDVL